MSTLISRIEQATFDREGFSQNLAREMFDVIAVETTGTGQQVLANPIMFKGPFPNRPYVTHGCEVVRPVAGDAIAVPLASGCVYRWELNERGFYIGAYFGMRVDASPADAGLLINHTFTIFGVSYKDLSEQNQGQVIAAYGGTGASGRVIPL